MIILILSLLALILGIIFAVKGEKSFDDTLSIIGILFFVFAVIALSVEIILLLMKPLDYKSFKIKYDTIKETITSADDIRDTNYTKELIEINTEINKNRVWIESPWVGIFNNKKIAELELLIKEKE